VLWVDNEEDNNNDDEFSLTANETRLGFLLNGPSSDGLRTSGRVEFDFFGAPADENKARIQMRHAYLELAWPNSGVTLLAGQTWDVISPLNPSTLNYTVLWDVGNVGYRRPQIRFTKDVSLSDTTALKLTGAITRTIGDNGIVTEAGEDAGFPTVQGRAGLTFPWMDAGPTTVGFSWHWGEEEYDDTPAAGQTTDADSWSVNLDWLQPLAEAVTLKAEVFTGENLDTYFGGIGQGINSTTYEEIASKGGWCALALGPWDKWSFNTGIGIDDVDSDDVEQGDRTLNRAIFGNAIYALNDHTDVGVELSHWRTDYKGEGDADNLRLQASFKYKF
jgi:hypothetical protein